VPRDNTKMFRAAVQALVQIDANREQYEELKRDGTHLVPFKCNSTQIAAYRAKPKIEFTLDEVLETAKAWDAKTDTFVEPPVQDSPYLQAVSELGLEGDSEAASVVEQYRQSGRWSKDKIAFWEDNSDDVALRERFSAEQLIRTARPSNESHDRIGISESFRVRELTLNKIRNGRATILAEEVPMLNKALEQEKQRIGKDLKQLREHMISVLRAQWKATLNDAFDDDETERGLQIDAANVIKQIDKKSNLQVSNTKGYKQVSSIAKLIDIHRHFVRLNSILEEAE